MAEDSFEKAREAFFGTVKTSPKPSASPAEFVKPRNEAPQKKSPASSSDEYEAAPRAVEVLEPSSPEQCVQL
jgi:hypothetical protein